MATERKGTVYDLALGQFFSHSTLELRAWGARMLWPRTPLCPQGLSWPPPKPSSWRMLWPHGGSHLPEPTQEVGGMVISLNESEARMDSMLGAHMYHEASATIQRLLSQSTSWMVGEQYIDTYVLPAVCEAK